MIIISSGLRGRFVLKKREICSQRARFAHDLNFCHSLLKKCKKLTRVIRRSLLLKHVISNKLLINDNKRVLISLKCYLLMFEMLILGIVYVHLAVITIGQKHNEAISQ